MAPRTKLILAFLGFLWAALVLAAFYVVQRPLSGEIVRELAATGWTLVVTLLLVVNSAGLGLGILHRWWPTTLTPGERLLFGTGLGLGWLGLLGLGIALLNATSHPLLLAFHVGLNVLLWLRGYLTQAGRDLLDCGARWSTARLTIPPLLRVALGIALLWAFLLALLPPADAFDALFYHLAWPERILRDGFQLYNIPHFWFPGLVEGTFLWALALGSDRAPQLLHLTWALLAIGLTWYWALKAWDARRAWRTLALLISMPSLPLLAAWAYTDLALTFYSVATLYAVWRWQESTERRWLWLGGLAAGMAMSVKYTSVLVPLVAGLLILLWQRRGRLWNALTFGGTALAAALPWYLRTWLAMGNPFYPFIFGGRYWDAFRAAWYAEPGTGIGWNWRELLLLPFNATLGHRDANFYDGRIGPLFLLLLPATLMVLWEARRAPRDARRATLALGLFALASGLLWTGGVINTAALWQTRLLFPALIPFALLVAGGWEVLERLDTSVLRLSRLGGLLIGGVLAVTLLDEGLFVLGRRPLAVATGLESRADYLARVQPAYSQALTLLDDLPTDAHVYFLFEPRSYGASREVQPDPILDNFAHDLYLYGDAAGVVQAWRAAGYTHVLLYRWGADFVVQARAVRFPATAVAALQTVTETLLQPVSQTADGHYELYRLP